MRIIGLALISALAASPTALTDCAGEPTDDELTVSNPQWDDSNGDGVWSRGETLRVTIDITNTSGEDNLNYPGVMLVTDYGSVNIEPPEYSFYGIFAGDTYQAYFSVTAPLNAPSGQPVTLTAWGTELHCNGSSCPSTNEIDLDLTIQ